DTAGTAGTDAATEALFGCAGVPLATAAGRSYLGPLFAAGAAPTVTLVTSWSQTGSRQLVDAIRALVADPDYARCYAQHVAGLLVAGRVKVDGVATVTAAVVRGAQTVPAPDRAAARLDAQLDVTGPAGVVPVHVVVVPVLDRAVASTLVVTRPTAAPETAVVDAATAQLVRKIGTQ
nr:hypothetical protein [Micromonospora sp. DSM 115978]